MEKNVGKADRIVRVVLAAATLYLAFVHSYWWLVLTAIFVITAATGFCYPYKLLGINTCRNKR